MVDIRCISPIRAELGEGAFWDDRAQVLWWVDITNGTLYQYNPETDQTNDYDFGEPVGCLAVREQGGLVIAAKSGFWFFDPDTGNKQKIHDPESHLPNNRFNDGTTDRHGRLWAGTMCEGSPNPDGSFYILDTDLKITQWRDKIYTTNGLAFSPDGKTMYYSDSYPDVQTIWTCDYDSTTGTTNNDKVYFDNQAIAGRPDGGTVDADGCYWSAGVGGWQVYRYSPDGDIIMTIDMPIEKPTKPMFGGKNLDILFVTSIGGDLSKDPKQPDAGGLFAITGLGIKGVPQTRFAG